MQMMKLIKNMFLLSVILPAIASCTARPEKPENSIYWDPVKPLSIPVNLPQEPVNPVVKISWAKLDIPVSNVRVIKNPGNTVLVIPPMVSLPYSVKKTAAIQALEVSDNRTNLIFSGILNTEAPSPAVEIIKVSPVISRGGSAVAAFRVRLPDVKTAIIENNDGDKFFAQKVQNSDVFICPFSWPIKSGGFDARILVGNSSGSAISLPVPILTRNKKIHVSRIRVDSDFTADKLQETGSTNRAGNAMERYRNLMKDFENKHEVNIIDFTSLRITNALTNFNPAVFNPFPGYRVTSPFGFKRIYMLGRKYLKTSYHLGMDLAKSAESDVHAASGGTVVYAGYNGPYGNMTIIHHGLGIYSIYCHCSRLLVKKGEAVKAFQRIATSGCTGYAIGDHLHFGVLIQGKYVDPSEWMSQDWLEENVTAVVGKAMKMINGGGSN